MAKCKETAGVLFAHVCTQEATLSCVACSKPICEMHSRQLPSGVTCIQCYKEQRRDQSGDGGDPFFMAAAFFPDYDTGGLSAPRLHRALQHQGDLSDLDDDTVFEGDFDGT